MSHPETTLSQQLTPARSLNPLLRRLNSYEGCDGSASPPSSPPFSGML